ncbi:MAG: alpha/beta fold hydrolase [Hydrogenophaga sp.]|uniref:alpha/beta hydrolase n=1 Tax=Hydrogenophaga sp. TaxID=1904254 RepID=UPI002731D283|nr:alpha/beta fold hydrolase [Hydrogenophaga sp.]MDP2405160.1 alpha/beta fold hydrolase [Hydrogenophaga sp.]MDZ4175911.1 alpha/beta fold hydrolase [Hydrogenophaga sp.]
MNAPDFFFQHHTIALQEFVTGRDPAATPVASLIVLHGLGTTGVDFMPLLRSMDLAAVGPVRCVFPDAPWRTMSLNGTDMHAWYDAAPPETRRHASLPLDETGLRESQAMVQALIEQEQAQGMPSERIVLMGFSQGAVLALHTGLRAPQRLAAIVALSGYLPLGARTLQTESNAANQRLPIFLAHGEQDEVVVIDRARAARTVLQVMGHLVEWHNYPMGHEVSDTELTDVSAWLTGVLSVV